MSIREVNITEYFDQALPLMRLNWEETGFNFEFNPNKQFYENAQAQGFLFALAAFEGEELVGYSTAFISPHQFYPAMKYCATDALYVRPQNRSGTIGGRLILQTEQAALKRGANFISWHTRAGTSLASTLRRRGYLAGDAVMMKEF